AWRATRETDLPGSKVCCTKASFSSGVQRLRRCTPVITSTRSVLVDELIVVNIGVFLGASLRNTPGPVNQGASSSVLQLLVDEHAGCLCAKVIKSADSSGWRKPERFDLHFFLVCINFLR